MNRLGFLLVPLIALAASLAPADRGRADRSERVRFDHRRHARYLPPCTFCHRPAADAPTDPTASGLDFARPVEAMCFCHPLPEGSPPPAPAVPPPPVAPAPEPGAKADLDGAGATKQAAPGIPHPLEGRDDCSMCHAVGTGMKPAPADHAGRTNDTCTMCHAALPSATPTPPPAEAAAASPAGRGTPTIPHPIEGVTDCLMCHMPGGDLKPAPADHAGRTNDTCLACHAPAAPAPPDVPPQEPDTTATTTTTAPPAAAVPAAIPHPIDGLPGCTTCHKARGLRPIPADHEGRTDDTCTMCHVASPPAQSASAAAGPDPDVCGMCHATNPQRRVALPALAEPAPPALLFGHPQHAAAVDAPCDACHTPTQADSGRPPSMQVCMTCHTDAMATCTRCHLHDVRGRLVTGLPDGRKLVPTAWWGAAAHVEGFDAGHGRAARTDEALCRNCHEQTFCEGCHLGIATERRFHGAGWLSMHGPSSRSSDLDCTTCHDEQDTCLSCHRRAGVALESPDSAVPDGAGRYHPADWTYSPSGHPREARRSLGSCVACHSQGDCFTCHSGISPHGDSWRGGRCSTMEDSSPGLCLQCHESVPECD